MAANSSEPCLYFVRAWRNQRVTEWIPLHNVIQEHRIRSRELQTATQGLLFNEVAPSYWSNNGVYQANMMGAANSNPQQLYAVIKLPISLVTNLTEAQALEVVRQIEPHVTKNLSWSSTDLHSIARVNHLPKDENAARGFYKKGDAFFREIKRHQAANKPADTLGHKYGLGAKQVAQAAPVTVTAAAPAPAKRATAPAAPPAASPAPQPAGHVPSRNFNLHRRFGLKGTHPDPNAIKALKRIWNAQKTNAPAEAEDVPPAPPVGDKPAND